MNDTERQFLRELLDRGALLPDARELAQLMLKIDDRRRRGTSVVTGEPPLVMGGQGRSSHDVRASGLALALLTLAAILLIGSLAWRLLA